MIENEPVVARGEGERKQNKNTRREKGKEGEEGVVRRKKKGGVGERGEWEGRPQGGREEIDASKGG